MRSACASACCPRSCASSDILSLHVPLNASTQHMIGAAELAAMKPSAIIVNTSRGPVIDEKAMTAALSAGKLFGAGLDVFDEEPTPPDNPLLKLDNVVLTAHLAGPTFESNITRLRNGFDNVQRVARGEPALWVVPELARLGGVTPGRRRCGRRQRRGRRRGRRCRCRRLRNGRGRRRTAHGRTRRRARIEELRVRRACDGDQGCDQNGASHIGPP